MRARTGRRARRLVAGTVVAVVALGLIPIAAADARPRQDGPVAIDEIAEVAEANDTTPEDARDLLADETVQVAPDGTLVFADPVHAAADGPTVPLGGIARYADTLALHSRPSSNRTIFLDFDGHTVADSVWPADDSGPYDAREYDSDETPGFSLRERDEIQYIWRQVAEDFAAMDVDVTTQEPSAGDLRRDSESDPTYGTRIVLTDAPFSDLTQDSSTGIASFKAFDAIGPDWDARGAGAWVFPVNLFDNPKLVAEVTTHEIGHVLGLRHDGTAAEGTGSYYAGHGVWGPIMGAAYGRAVGQWSKGEYADANNLEDDLAVMATHGVAPLADDHAGTRANATTLPGTGTAGVITAGSDADLFRFVAPATGNWTFRAAPTPVVSDLDIQLSLLSATGTPIAQDDPPAASADDVVATGLDAAVTAPVTAGTTYYLRVASAAHLTPATGYSTYGSIGPYTLRAAPASTPTCASQDTGEPNDTTRTASTATSGQALSSRVCDGNLDYYAIPALQGQTIDAALQFTNAAGNLDLALLDPSGATVALATTNSGTESLAHVATESGTYTVEVSGRDRASNAYSLAISSPLCAPDDPYEDNDTFATAKPATRGTTLFGASCPADPDWFSVPVAAGEVIQATVRHDHRFGSLGLELVDGSGTSIVLDTNASGTDALTVTAPAAAASGTWRARVIPSAGRNAYALTVRSSPPAPTGVTVVAGPGSATVSWAPPPSDGGSPITRYEVGLHQAGNLIWSDTRTESPTTISGLPQTPYAFAVRAINGTGSGPWSVLSSPVTPTAPTAAGAPTALVVVPGNAMVQLKWKAPFDGGTPVGAAVVTPYIGGVAQPSVERFGGAPHTTLYGLANGTTYTFTVALKTGTGVGPPSAMSAPVTLAGNPSAPTNVTAAAGDRRATVSWTAPTATGGVPITSYEVTPYIGLQPLPPVTSAGAGTTKVLTGLTNGTAYTFRVTASNAVRSGEESAPSAPVTPLAPYAPFGSWAAFVDRQFLDLTTKAPTSTQRTSWVNQLNAGNKAKGDLADALRRGPENLANVDPVVRVYRAFLGRAPDAGGLQFWIKRKRNVAPAKTWSVTQIATEFTNSNEFKTKYGSLTNRQFVTQIYTDVLGRTADPSGVNYWTGKLDRKEKTKAQVVVGFSESNEYKTKQAQNTDVAVAYTYLLGRAPTTAEASDWVTRQKAGTTHAALLTELLNSATYATRITG